MDAIRQRVVADLGEEDATYIRKVVKASAASRSPAGAVLRPAGLAARRRRALRVEDPRQHGDRPQRHARPVRLDGRPRPELADVRVGHVCPSEQWKYGHNYMHHTYTNILGKDRDIGYGILRMDEDQQWHPYYLGNPLYAFLLMMFFEWGVALHDLEVENIVNGKRTWAENKRARTRGIMRKVRKRRRSRTTCSSRRSPARVPARPSPATPWPTWSATSGRSTSSSAATSRPASRPSPRRSARTSRAATGTTASCSARPTSPAASCFHVMTGNLSHQIEHHLFPDLPARRYPEIAGRGAGDLRALRPGIQHRPARPAARQRRREDLPAGAPGPEAGTAGADLGCDRARVGGLSRRRQHWS